MSSQRKLYKQGKLDDECTHLLESLDFSWDTYTTAWEDRFLELKAYREEYGHCNVPQRSKNHKLLAPWVHRQRRFYKQGRLNDDRIYRLEEIGFVWDPIDATWKKKYLELKAYREKFGHCRVTMPNKEYHQLGAWVKNQRTALSQGKLDAERIRQLDEIGFVWKPKVGSHYY